MATIAAKMTVADYEKLSLKPGERLELHHGELVQVTFPSKKHYKIQKRIERILGAAATGWGFVGVEVAFRPLPEHELWVAEVAVVSAGRWDNANEVWLSGSPEIVIEVLSPSNTASEMLDREETCRAGGCLEFWTVDPASRKVRITYAAGITRTYSDSDSIPLPLFGAAAIAVADIFNV